MKKLMWIMPLACLSGCFTVRQTEMPQVTMSRLAEGRDVKVAVSGFAAFLTEYIPIYGHETVYVDDGPYYVRRGRKGRPGGWYYGGGHLATATTETLVPQTRANDAFLRRAQTALEENGFLVRAVPAAYTVDVTFDGPFVSNSEVAAEWAWMLCSILTTEYSVQTWTAKLKIYDSASGRVLYHEDFRQTYEDLVFSPLFFIGLAGYGENTYNYMQNWCLAALTDRAIASATAFLAAREK